MKHERLKYLLSCPAYNTVRRGLIPDVFYFPLIAHEIPLKGILTISVCTVAVIVIHDSVYNYILLVRMTSLFLYTFLFQKTTVISCLHSWLINPVYSWSFYWITAGVHFTQKIDVSAWILLITYGKQRDLVNVYAKHSWKGSVSKSWAWSNCMQMNESSVKMLSSQCNNIFLHLCIW